jgi:hypothetical protein
MAFKNETVLALRVPTPVANTLRRRAHADDRPLSSYLRVLLSALAAESEQAAGQRWKEAHARGHVGNLQSKVKMKLGGQDS